MINIFFVPGMFGTMIEYALKNHTHEYGSLNQELCDICEDGSMHNYNKTHHFWLEQQLKEKIKNVKPGDITTPTYPFRDLHLPDILNLYQEVLPMSHNVLIHAGTQQQAELNMLFQYHKISFGSRINLGLKIFCDNSEKNIVQWNANYTHWEQMQRWELREWFSLFYPVWISEWVDSKYQVDTKFLTISNIDLLCQTAPTVNKIIQHCGLIKLEGLDQFLDRWRCKQQYIVDKFFNLEKIVQCTVEHVEFVWEDLDIISEAIVQHRLREKKFEIRCDSLNIFPTNSASLYNLLEKC